MGLFFAQSQAFSADTKAPETELLAEENQTVIEGKIESQNDAKFNVFPDQNAKQMLSDSSMLFHIPGLTLTERGGPLGSSELRYRGLSNSRLRIDLDGLNLNNPVNGFSDANAMFLFAASRMQTNAQSLSISLPTFREPYAKGLFGIGSQSSIKAGASVGAPIDDYSSMFAAMQISSTDGKFAYSLPHLDKKDPNNHYYRQNNDQHRLQALLKYQRDSPTGSGHALLAFNTHEGGIAGFQSSPSPDLRSRSVYSGLSAGISKKLDNAEFYTSASNSLFNYQSTDIPKNDEQFMSTTHELTLGLRPIKWFKAMDFDLAQKIIIERAYEIDQTRVGGGLEMKRASHLSGRMKPTIFSNFSMIGYQTYGLVFKKDLGVSIEPNDRTSLTLRFARSQRLPTFMELHANNRFFAGNPDLEKESVWDLELGTNYQISQKARVHVSGFLGHLSNVIVYVPLLASKQRPINVDAAKRYGLDMNFAYEPLNWLLFETNNSLLFTRVKATNAPLPQAPPFLGFSKLRFGTEDFINLSLLSRYRGPTSANMNGTLKTKAYALIDTILSARVYKKVTTSFSVSNIFNIKTARDIYEMPLPGTIFFGQVELENM